MSIPPAEETVQPESTPVRGAGEASSVAPISTKRPGALTDFIRRVRGNRSAVIALAVLISLTLLAIIAPWITPHDPAQQDLTKVLLAPGSEGHLLGTDQLGRDILSRLLTADDTP